mmetsp:Transcript_13110/g.37849  ORF Transcript_13110/g.37849 Transcript_13110/m.37849 type:complete len:219 (-) Transcript_13110:994-1650(-)
MLSLSTSFPLLLLAITFTAVLFSLFTLLAAPAPAAAPPTCFSRVSLSSSITVQSTSFSLTSFLFSAFARPSAALDDSSARPSDLASSRRRVISASFDLSNVDMASMWPASRRRTSRSCSTLRASTAWSTLVAASSSIRSRADASSVRVSSFDFWYSISLNDCLRSIFPISSLRQAFSVASSWQRVSVSAWASSTSFRRPSNASRAFSDSKYLMDSLDA